MRFRLAFALTALTTALGAYLAACSSEDNIEDLCGWLGDENNCYRQFYADITTTCGTKGPNSARDGSFLKRDKLDTCVLDGAEGGQVVFDPPLDIATDFPVTTASFAMIRGDGTICGAAAFGSDGAMALSVEAVSVDENGIVTPLGDGGLPDSGTSCVDSTDPICGGSFSVKPVTEREIVDVTCSTATRKESHRFNRLQLAKCDGTKDNAPDEANVAALFPRAEFESNPGGVALEGYVLFRVFFPPATGELEGAQPEVVEYFRCRIPSAPNTCANGVQDEGEPAIDCGVLCGKGCCNSDPCYINSDCESGVCSAVDGGMGIRRCIGDGPICTPPAPAPDAGTDGG
ncbi:hypothetical protein [Polyangium spumosum]|uniref:Uncharacterized protein n=1 Tax=Polyangium spumosum TaxID=889282 RepID=A0A6N7PHQ5_9BACT|nr:hypothetical protein [Polyangium spumosum]MRG91337.1 hypothetical protein [Polyangium spumosum]